MIVKDEGNRKRRKLGRKGKDLIMKTSECGLPHPKTWRKMLKYLEDSEDLKVSLGELEEQLETR